MPNYLIDQGAVRYDFVLERGVDWTLPIQLLQPDATTPVDLTGCRSRIQIRTGPYSAPGADPAVLTLDSQAGADGLITIDVPTGTITPAVSAAQTAGLKAGSGNYCYDWFVYDANGKATRYFYGNILVREEVTQPQ